MCVTFIHPCVSPNFTLVNYGEHPISIPAHKLWFKATFADIETAVDCVQDLPGGPGLQSMEQQLNNIQSCNFYEWKETYGKDKKSAEID